MYGQFSEVYDQGEYAQYSLGMVPVLQAVLERHGRPPPARLLDLACGSGHFAVAWALRGDAEVWALDGSPSMLGLARERALQEKAKVNWVDAKLPAIPVPGQFDVVTCWFDSLNYITEEADLRATFRNVSALLRPGGLFIFDMATLFGLSEVWGVGDHVRANTPDLLEVQRVSFDHETGLYQREIIAFVRRRLRFERIEETHLQRGYPLSQIADMLKAAKLIELERFGDDESFEAPDGESERVWFVAQRA